MIESSVTIGEFYDGDGKRVKKIAGSEETIFVYDAGGKLIGEYSNIVQTGSNAKTVYTTNDHLGSPRINTDGVGAVVSRHDYHPFGEEIARTGYGSDTIRKQFTSYERDDETDLDFAQARYYDKNHGRFTGVDPLLSTGSIYNPQTWNRYSYTLNSPLKYTDPSGMYICDGDKSQCKNIEQGIKKAQEALKNLNPMSDQYRALDRALKTYGAAGIDNGVTVKFGTNKANNPANTVMGIRADKDGKKLVTSDNPTGRDMTITFDTKQNNGSTDYAISLAHEGSHVADGTDFAAALAMDLGSQSATEMFSNSPLNLTKYDTEMKAYGVSAALSQGWGNTSLKIGPKNNETLQYEIWNSGWKTADLTTKQNQGIEKVLALPKSQGGLYEITKDDPGVKLYP